MTTRVPTTIAYEEIDGSTSSISFDAVVREVHREAAAVTEHAVEDGANVADHVRPELDRLTLEVYVSNTPLRAHGDHMSGATGAIRSVDLSPYGADGGRSTALQWSGEFDRRKAVYDELGRLRRQGGVVRVVTELREYERMVIVSLETAREVQTADALVATVELTQVRIVQAATTSAVPVPAEPRGRRRRNRGTQATSPVGDGSGDEPTRSLAHRALGALGL